MTIKMQIKDMKVQIDLTIEEFLAIKEAKKESKKLDGYDVEQYTPGSVMMKYEETYKGFRIYSTGTMGYYRFFKGEDYESRSELFDDVRDIHRYIDDVVERMNHG